MHDLIAGLRQIAAHRFLSFECWHTVRVEQGLDSTRFDCVTSVNHSNLRSAAQRFQGSSAEEITKNIIACFITCQQDRRTLQPQPMRADAVCHCSCTTAAPLGIRQCSLRAALGCNTSAFSSAIRFGRRR